MVSSSRSAEDTDLDLSIVESSICDVAELMTLPCKALSLVSTSKARELAPILGSINTAAIVAQNGGTIDLTFPDNSVQWNYYDDFMKVDKDNGLTLGVIAAIVIVVVVVITEIIVRIVLIDRKNNNKK